MFISTVHNIKFVVFVVGGGGGGGGGDVHNSKR